MSIVPEKLQQQVEESFPLQHATYDVVVVGAGPYGLTTAAHLLGKGFKVGVFGKPLELWRNYMPKGMYLRSHWWASNLSDPYKKYTFERFFNISQHQKSYPVPSEAFIQYGLWFQRHAVPYVDETYVSCVQKVQDSFKLTLADGRVVRSQVVVIAVGLYYYANRPEEYAGLPTELVTHSFEHNNFQRFAGKHVLVVGGGQSAVEYSALLYESGAQVDLVARQPIHWLGPDRSAERSWWERIREPNAGIAPGWRNWALEYLPYMFYRFPQNKKDYYLSTRYGAAASHWLRERVLGKVTLHEGTRVEKLVERDGGISATLSDGQKLQVDHVLLATGYAVDLRKLPLLHSELREKIKMDQHVPVLNHWFESSVDGLYFVGLSSIRAFGPLYRFVVGNKATAERVAKSVAQQLTRR